MDGHCKFVQYWAIVTAYPQGLLHACQLYVCMLCLQEKARKLHEQLHGSTFHLKLAKEAMKKVRQAEAEAEVAAKEAAEAEAGTGLQLIDCVVSCRFCFAVAAVLTGQMLLTEQMAVWTHAWWCR